MGVNYGDRHWGHEGFVRTDDCVPRS